MNYSELKHRYIGLDILKIFSAFIVCLYHTIIHLNCNYGIFQHFFEKGYIFMISFFMLSGFLLFVNWNDKNLSSLSNVKHFYKKRILSIVPMYYFVATIFVIIEILISKETIKRTIVLLPVELFCIQNMFHSLSTFSHNGATWFISCIMICYLAYPFLQEIITQSNKKVHCILLLICSFIVIYSNFVTEYFEISRIYNNPFFRLLEFFTGMIIAALKVDFSKSKITNKIFYKWSTVIGVATILFFAVTFLGKTNIAANCISDNLIPFVCFGVILFALSGIKNDLLDQSKTIVYISKLTYPFFLAQLFSNTICKHIFNHYSIMNNSIRILLGIGMCLIIAGILNTVENATKTIMHKKKFKSLYIP